MSKRKLDALDEVEASAAKRAKVQHVDLTEPTTPAKLHPLFLKPQAGARAAATAISAPARPGKPESKIESKGGSGEGSNSDEAIFRALLDNFNHTEFRPGQFNVVKDVLAGRDVLWVAPRFAFASLNVRLRFVVSMLAPTGGGKSLCFQVSGGAALCTCRR